MADVDTDVLPSMIEAPWVNLTSDLQDLMGRYQSISPLNSLKERIINFVETYESPIENPSQTQQDLSRYLTAGSDIPTIVTQFFSTGHAADIEQSVEEHLGVATNTVGANVVSESSFLQVLQTRRRNSPITYSPSVSSSSGSRSRSDISDQELQLHERPAPINMFAFYPESTSLGEEFRGRVDTGHWGGAPLLSEKIVRQLDLDWKSALSVVDEPIPSLTYGNGNRIQALGQVTLTTQFRDNDGNVFSTKTLTYHVVPAKSIPCDCLINWKTILRMKKLQAYVFQRLPWYPALLRQLQRDIALKTSAEGQQVVRRRKAHHLDQQCGQARPIHDKTECQEGCAQGLQSHRSSLDQNNKRQRPVPS